MQHIVKIGKCWFPEESGGLNRYFYASVHYLPHTGIRVHGLVAGSAQVSQGLHGAISAFAPSQSFLLTRWQGARRSLPTYLNQADVIVSHFAFYTFPRLGQLRDQSLLVHFHGPWALESQAEGTNSIGTQVKKWLEQICYGHAAVFIVLSQAFQTILHENYGILLHKIVIVPAGVDAAHFQTHLSRAEARTKLGWEQDRPTIIAVRRLAKRMGLENLVQAIAQFKHKQQIVALDGIRGCLKSCPAKILLPRTPKITTMKEGFQPNPKGLRSSLLRKATLLKHPLRFHPFDRECQTYVNQNFT